MTQIDEKALDYALSKHLCTCEEHKPCRIAAGHLITYYEAAKAPRTISREELDNALKAMRLEESMGGSGGAGMRKALATLGITVGD